MKLKGLLLIISILFFISCDFIAAGSNLMAERYSFSVSRDKLDQRLVKFNTEQILSYQDSLFIVMDYNPHYKVGKVIDVFNGDVYKVLILLNDSMERELLLIGVYNDSGYSHIINDEPRSKEEIRQRKSVMHNFETRILDKLGLSYKHTGNRMLRRF